MRTVRKLGECESLVAHEKNMPELLHVTTFSILVKLNGLMSIKLIIWVLMPYYFNPKYNINFKQNTTMNYLILVFCDIYYKLYNKDNIVLCKLHMIIQKYDLLGNLILLFYILLCVGGCMCVCVCVLMIRFMYTYQSML